MGDNGELLFIVMCIVSSNWLRCSCWRQIGNQFHTSSGWRTSALHCVWVCRHWRSCTGYVQHRCCMSKSSLVLWFYLVFTWIH